MATKRSPAPDKRSAPGTSSQRDALEQSEKKSSVPKPESYQDEGTAEKVVEIGPDLERAPITGIDPVDPDGSGRGDKGRRDRKSGSSNHARRSVSVAGLSSAQLAAADRVLARARGLLQTSPTGAATQD